jgi:hypothetical protein
MKAKLVKKADGWYNLYDGEIGIGSTHPELQQPYKLSIANCDEIFGVTDVEKLAMGYDLYEKINFVGQTRAYKAGFNKAIELNKDKLFTLEDMKNAFYNGWNYRGEDYQWPTAIKEYLQHLQQLNEIEVEIETETKVWEFISNGEFESFEIIPKLDSNGCIILKKL